MLDDRLSRAAESGATEYVIALIDETRLFAPDAVADELQLALLWAAIGGQVDTIERLVNEGANVNSPEPNRGHLPIVGAAEKGRTEAIKKMIELGANVNLTDRWDRSPADMARRYGHTELAALLHEQTKGEQKRGSDHSHGPSFQA